MGRCVSAGERRFCSGGSGGGAYHERGPETDFTLFPKERIGRRAGQIEQQVGGTGADFGSGNVHRRQGRAEPFGSFDIVKSGYGDVFRNPQTEFLGGHGNGDRVVVVDANNCGRRIGSGKDFHPFFDLFCHRVCAEQGIVFRDGKAVARHFAAESDVADSKAWIIVVSREADSPMAEIFQVFDDGGDAADVVDGDDGYIFGSRDIEENDGKTDFPDQSGFGRRRRSEQENAAMAGLSDLGNQFAVGKIPAKDQVHFQTDSGNFA